VTVLTLDQIAAKIATAEVGLASATTQYDRNVLAQVCDDYRRYAAERTKQIAKATLPQADSSATDIASRPSGAGARKLLDTGVSPVHPGEGVLAPERS